MRISREIEVDIDVELDDVIEYIGNCYSKKELQEIKEAVLEELEEVDDDNVDGILVQLPLPKQINEQKIIS
jgi:5,10-methylene-tetrahydrofolate dehydrogenase/methenyl tetrahydrofolate cyclohydrolase